MTADAPVRSKSRKNAARKKSAFREWFEVIAGSLVLFLFFRTLVFQAFQIPSESMENTLLVGDYLFVNKFLYGAKIPFTAARLPDLRPPERGDIAVFHYPGDSKTTYIKRVIGLPGDTLQIKDRIVHIDGEPIEEDYVKFLERRRPDPGYRDPRIKPMGAGNMDHYGPVVVPEGHYFMMGDNRDNSDDSRLRGFIPFSGINGRASFIYFSWDRTRKRLRPSRIGDLIR
jgi:signal peptidase I